MERTALSAALRIDTTTSWLLLEDETTENRLLALVGEVLGIDKDSVPVDESFLDLGGDEVSAIALRRTCLRAGIDVQTKDILRCRTLAELQTCVTPCTPLAETEYPEIDDSVMVAPLEICKPGRLSVDDNTRGGRSRTSSQSSTASQGGQRTESDRKLALQETVDRIVTVRPKAGLLEGKLVALLTLSGTTPAQADPSTINLIPQSYALLAGTQLAALKDVAKSTLPPDHLPQVWIVLDAMPLTEWGAIDIRRLRTWAQNINQDMFYQATSLEHQEALQAPGSNMEKSLQRLISKVLDVPPGQIGVNYSFCQLGGDELTAMELAARCKHESIYLNANEALGQHTLAELANLAASRGGLAHKWDDDTHEQFDLSPMQHLYFETTMGGDTAMRSASDGSYRFNQSLLLRFKKPFPFEDIAAAIEAVVAHHPMLRSRYVRGLNRWTQLVLPETTDSYALRVHDQLQSDQELELIIEATQKSINIETGPVFSADYLATADGQQMVYLAAHHLAVDLPSWRIIIHDLDELLDTGSFLSQRSMPFHKWVDLQKSDVRERQPKDLVPFTVLPGDYSYWGLENNTSNTYSDALEASFSLSPELTSILQTSCNQVFKTDCVDIYLSALMLSFAQTFHDRRVPVVWNQEHGREPLNPDIDISETVGWFTSLCPINQKIEGSDDFISVLRQLKDTRRDIPGRGSQYFASRFYNAEHLMQDWPFEIIFSYAGSLQHLERDNGVLEQLAIPGRTLASPTSDIGAKVGRIALFEISAMIDQGAAKIKFLYSRHSKDKGRILQWVQNYEHLLLEAIGRLRYHPQELTLSDVPYLDVTYEGLSRFNKQRLAALKLSGVRDVETIYPVTAVQQDILISQAQRPDACYLHAIYEFASPNGAPIDTSRICTAWQLVTMHHAALRTIFTDSVSETGLWDKVILRRASPEMLFIDIAPEEDPVYELSNLPNLRPTDGKPLHRLTVCKAPTRTFVKLDISTALCDSLSIHVLFHDLRRAYVTERAISDTAQFSYPQYLQFLNGARQEQSLDYWRGRLSGVPPCIFPRLRTTPEEQRFENAFLNLEITSYELSAFARTHQTTVEAVLQLAWGLVLRVFTGSSKVSFGYQTIGRDDSVEDLRYAVGSFSGIVPCNYELSSYDSLDSALRTVKSQMNDLLPHQHFTVAELKHAMGLKGGDQLFNTCLTFTEEPSGLNSKFTTRTNFELKPVTLQQTFDVDVAMNTRFSAGKLTVDIGQRVMALEQALNVANTFGKAIRTILASPETSIGLVDLFTDRDYAQIVAWDAESPTTKDTPASSVVHDLVRKQASLQPSTQAVCSWDGSLTYRQLDEEATKLAHHLVDVGVGPHSVVPVVLVKSRLVPVAMLAVLKSGAAFVPIDALELNMLQPIFERLNSRVCIASEDAAPVLGNLFDRVVVLDDELMNTIPHGQGSLTSMAAPSDPACILFLPTSSSEARGVSFSHTALSAALLGQGPAAKITSLSRVLQLSSFNVDICITEIFTTLVHGGCVCIPSAAERLQDFTGAVNRMQVTWTYMTPLLSRKLDPTLLPTVDVVCFRTRSLDEDTFNPWYGRVKVVLAYGPQDVCPLGICFLEARGPHHLRSIGRPFAGNLLVVNPEEHKNPVPVGAVGELVVEGPTLGCSYPNRDSTIGPMSPLGPNSSKKTRYFKTGHCVRSTETGLLEFISSRRDDLELGPTTMNITETEQAMRRCLGHGVDVFVELITFRGNKTPVLAAFIELGNSMQDGEENLAALSPTTKEQVFLAKQLVETELRKSVDPSMIPSIFIPVKSLPITPSFKVNRRRLQKLIHGLSRDQLMALSVVPNANEAKYQRLKPLPLTQIEERMRGIWARVLGVEEVKIGAHDNFFSVGGDQISAVQLVTACRRENISIPIADVLQKATLTEICRAATTIEPLQVATEVATVGPVLTPAPALPNAIKDTFIQRVIAPKIGISGSSIKDASEATATQIRCIETGMLRGRANINYLVFSFTGSVDPKKLEEACMALVRIHPIMRTAFVPYNRRVYQAVINAAAVEFKRHSCPTWRLSSTIDKMIRKDMSTPVAFCHPMTKFMFLDGGKQSTLIIRLSKAQYDDLSVALLVKDLKKLYDGTHNPHNPPRRPTYCDFVRAAQLANSNGAEEYWRALLSGAAITQVVGHQQPYQVTTRVKTIRSPQMAVGSLLTLGISFETILKSAWAMVLASMSASSDVVFGEVIDGRHLRFSGGNQVMGPTINTIPVRVQFPEETALTPLALLQSVQAQRVAGTPFENLGTLHIIEKCTPWPYWSRLSTVVQHQYEDTAISPSEPKTFHLGPAACKFTIVESKAQDVPDLFVRSLMRGAGRVELSITACTERVPEAFAEHALRTLCSTINLLTSVGIMQPLIPCGQQYKAMQKRIPLLPSTSLTSPAISSSPTSSSADAASALTEAQIRTLQTMIARVWTSILNPRTLGVPEQQVPDAAFFDLWGSLIPAAQLTAQLNRELPKTGLPGMKCGTIKLTMEEIVDNPTMLKQYELLAQKIKNCSNGQSQKGKDKEKDKKEKDKDDEQENESLDKLFDNVRLAPPTSSRRKPSVHISVSTAALGNRIRRFASTVARSGSPTAAKTTALAPSPLRLGATSPIAIGVASATVTAGLVSPLTPGEAAPTSNPTNVSPARGEAPQLPQLPALSPMTAGATVSFANNTELAPRGNISSADSMTEGSSVSSGNTEDDPAAMEHHPGVRVPISPLIVRGSGEEEDLVSPLTAVSPTKGLRFFEGSSSALDAQAVSSSSSSPLVKKKRSLLFSKTGMSPVIGS